MAHKELLRDLIAWWSVYHVFRAKNPTSSQAWTPLATKLIHLTVSWMQRNLDYETNAKTPKSIFTNPGTLPGFLDPKRFNDVIKPAAAAYIFTQNANDPNATGFLPLLIWAVVAIIAFFTIQKVADDTTNTAADKTDLVNSTNQFCKDNNLTAEQCSSLLATSIAPTNTDNSSDTGFFGSIKKLLLWGAVAFVAVKFVIPEIQKQTQKKPQLKQLHS
jgi:hypothetical protein